MRVLKRLFRFLFLIGIILFSAKSGYANEVNRSALVFTDGSIVGDSVQWSDLLLGLAIEDEINNYSADVNSFDLLILDDHIWPSPSKVTLLNDFLDNGGNLILCGGVPYYLAGSTNLDSITSIIGAAGYSNAQGAVIVEDNMPFGLNYYTDQILYNWTGGSFAALVGLSDSTKSRIKWSNGTYNSLAYRHNGRQSYFTASAFAHESTIQILRAAIAWMVYDMCGDCNVDGKINIYDIVYLISFLYIEGQPPYNLVGADVNSDGSVNMFDITYIITYLYLDGPEPDCP